MATDFLDRCETLEECYEFMLGYAGQGLPGDKGSEIRHYLERAVEALDGLGESFKRAGIAAGLTWSESHENFLGVLCRDAQDSLATMGMVLSQRDISSQLIDNLNASIHLRALMTDLFLVGDILRAENQAATRSASDIPVLPK